MGVSLFAVAFSIGMMIASYQETQRDLEHLQESTQHLQKSTQHLQKSTHHLQVLFTQLEQQEKDCAKARKDPKFAETLSPKLQAWCENPN